MATRKPASKAAPAPKTSTPPAASKPAAGAAAPDYATIETDYRSGIKPLRQIAEEHGITEGAIRKRAKRDGWERDLSPRIQAKAEALVRKEAVRNEVRSEAKASEKQVVEANAIAVATVRLAHRKDIQRSRTIAMNLLAELEQQSGLENAALLAELGDLMRKPDENGQDRLNDLYQKIISLPGRAKTMKDLGECLRVLVQLERQAFGLLDGPDGEATSVPGSTRALTDTERAVRLSRLFSSNPAAAAAVASLVAGKA